MSTPHSNPNPFNDFHPVATETIMLTDTSTRWAQAVCRDIEDADDQWQSFLKALAIAGFEQWLSQGSIQLPITYAHTTLGTGTNIQVGDFQLCILPIGTLKDDQVNIPATVVTAKNSAHLYVLVEVHEEVEQVRVSTSLRHDQLKAYIKQHAQYEAEEYSIPISQFTVSPEKLLWYVSCLEPEAITESEIALPDGKEDITTQLNETITKVVNTGKWIQGQLDTVAKELAWQFIPSSYLSYEFRDSGDAENSLEKVPSIIDELRDRNVDISANAVGACQPVVMGDVVCYFYTFIWELKETEEWNSLFVLLGSGESGFLPVGIELQVSDQASVLSTSQVYPDEMTTFLYTQTIGNLDEQFTVEISFPNEKSIVLPPFGFDK